MLDVLQQTVDHDPGDLTASHRCLSDRALQVLEIATEVQLTLELAQLGPALQVLEIAMEVRLEPEALLNWMRYVLHLQHRWGSSLMVATRPSEPLTSPSTFRSGPSPGGPVSSITSWRSSRFSSANRRDSFAHSSRASFTCLLTSSITASWFTEALDESSAGAARRGLGVIREGRAVHEVMACLRS